MVTRCPTVDFVNANVNVVVKCDKSRGNFFLFFFLSLRPKVILIFDLSLDASKIDRCRLSLCRSDIGGSNEISWKSLLFKMFARINGTVDFFPPFRGPPSFVAIDVNFRRWQPCSGYRYAFRLFVRAFLLYVAVLVNPWLIHGFEEGSRGRLIGYLESHASSAPFAIYYLISLRFVRALFLCSLSLSARAHLHYPWNTSFHIVRFKKMLRELRRRASASTRESKGSF